MTLYNSNRSCDRRFQGVPIDYKQQNYGIYLTWHKAWQQQQQYKLCPNPFIVKIIYDVAYTHVFK